MNRKKIKGVKMNRKKISGLFCCAVLLFYVAVLGFADDKGDYLLTENGANNSIYSEYKNTPVLKTGGNYYAMPAFASAEKGTVTAPTSFSEGVLCNGDTCIDHKRTPFPYAYWYNKPFASLFFDLKKQYFISKVRVKILLIPKVHGISKIGVYTWDEMLDADAQPLKEIAVPINGWNEFVIDKPSDKIKLDVTSSPGCLYMTVTEVEIWGRETTQPVTKSGAPKSVAQASLVHKNYLAFDFGPADSPIWDGFIPVSENTVYTKERGYGWVPFKGGKTITESNYGAGSGAVPGLLSRDRGKEVKVYDNFYRGFCGAEKAYHSQVEQEFDVDIKNGKYLVYIGSGDIQYGKPGVKKTVIDSESKHIVTSLNYDSTLRTSVQFETEVKDGQLNLRFGSADDKPVWNISGIFVFPCNNAIEKAAAQKTIEEFEKQIADVRKAAFSTVFKEVKYEETTKLFPLAKSDTDRGYIVFIRDWMKAIYPNTVPQKAEADAKELSIWCSPGEYEPATFGIYPLAKNLGAQITVSDLVSGAKDKISKDNISIRVTGYLPERIKDVRRVAGDYTYYLADGSWGTSYMEKTPKILWPCKGKISIDETKQIWLTVHVPASAKPGKYRGTVAFKPVGKPQQTLKLTVDVQPINLQKSDRVEGMFWLEGTRMYPQNRKKELADMAEHGIRSVVLGTTLPELNTENGKLTLGFTQLDALVQEMKDVGLTKYMPFYTASLVRNLRYLCNTGAVKMPFDDAYAYAIGEIYKHAKEKGWPEVLFYPVDEIGNSTALMNEFKHLVQLIKRTPGTKVYCTVNNYASGVNCADSIDYWCANIKMPKEQEQDVLSRGKALMRYGTSFNYNPRISRTYSGFGFWRIPATAMYYWHYQSIIGDPLNGIDGHARDHISSYPSPEGPINSIDFEAIREGIDDLNYIYTLQQLMEKARNSGKGDLAKTGESILDEIISCDPSYSQSDLAGVPNDKYHEWRLRMAQEIIKLQTALN